MLAVCFGTLRAAEDTSPDSVVENYWAASQQQAHALEGSSMEVDIQASLPKLRRQGRLHGLRRISRLGRITYEALHFEGDNSVKNHVIARYLEADADAQSNGPASLAVTPANYRFKYKGTIEPDGRLVQVFHVTPRHKRVGLFKGEIWIDATTFLCVRESGRLVKPSSIFLKKIEFVKEYEIQGGISVPREIRSVAYTRLVGPAELTVVFRNISLANVPQRASQVDVGDQ
ncbi:MAG TPA: hypothetical protein VMG35_07615 [Bryobacteraceae bacterium]|nr:hypothetical protein [Bryobacteraceae bacterium]